MKELIGTKINQIFVNEDQSLLKFVTDKGDMVYYADGDCCSESWFSDIDFSCHPSNFLGNVLTNVEYLELPAFVQRMVNKDERTRQDSDEVYGYRLLITTRYGASSACEIIFRNSSNGYYGGSCYLVANNTPWVKTRLESVEWEEIKNDWTA